MISHSSTCFEGYITYQLLKKVRVANNRGVSMEGLIEFIKWMAPTGNEWIVILMAVGAWYLSKKYVAGELRIGKEKMFESLLSLEKQRTKKQALGFYLAYALVVFSTSVLLSIINEIFLETVFDPLTFSAVLIHTGLSFGIAYKKRLGYGLKSMMFILGSAVITLVDLSLGLLLPTYLSTLKKNEVVN